MKSFALDALSHLLTIMELGVLSFVDGINTIVFPTQVDQDSELSKLR